MAASMTSNIGGQGHAVPNDFTLSRMSAVDARLFFRPLFVAHAFFHYFFRFFFSFFFPYDTRDTSDVCSVTHETLEKRKSRSLHALQPRTFVTRWTDRPAVKVRDKISLPVKDMRR